MILNTIRLKNFRFHEETELSFSRGVNLICGPNGIGKTNVLEAIHFLALTKGFVMASDHVLLRRGESFFELVGEFAGDRRKRVSVRVAYAGVAAKKLFVNGSEVERKTSHVGEIPVVLLCPQDAALTAGPPVERRRFLDNIISQSSAAYLKDLLRYRRALRQRNELLGRIRRRRTDGASAVLEPWTNELVETGSRIVTARMRFCSEFGLKLSAAHERLGDVVERPDLAYRTFDGLPEEADIAGVREAMRQALERVGDGERKRGVTLVGPHRDDLDFTLDGLDVRRYASQGQHRTFGVALKLAQYRYLLDVTGETPIMLLDDVFDNLDGTRIALFLDILREEGMGQTIITAARLEILDRFLAFGGDGVHLIELAGRDAHFDANPDAHSDRDPDEILDAHSDQDPDGIPDAHSDQSGYANQEKNLEASEPVKP
jgi:DNA replication and repair protein RecF